MNKRFDLIIFDWDGTLADSVDWIVHCIRQAAARQNCPVPEPQAVKDIIGLSIENAVATLFPGMDEETGRRLAGDYAQAFFSREMSRNDLFPGVPEMLARFREAGYRLAVATGKKSSGLREVIAGTGLADSFCTTRSADQTASKPNPLMIDEIVAELGVAKDRTLMVGDSVHDLQMALNAGVASVAVTCGAHPAETLKRYSPLYCLNYPTELLGLL